MKDINQKENNRLAPFLIIFSSICWGIVGLFLRPLMQSGLSALQILETRCLIAALVLFSLLLLTNRKGLRVRLRDLWLFVLVGVISIALNNLFYYIMIAESTLSIAVILLYTGPCFVVLMSCLFFRERFTVKKRVAIVLGFTGCLLTTGILGGFGETGISGFILIIGLGCGLCSASFSIIGKVLLKKYDSLTVMAWSFLFATLALLPFSNPSEILSLAVADASVIFHMLTMVAVSSLVPFLLYTKGLKIMETGKAALLTFFEPVVATIISVAVFHEMFTGIMAAGIGMVVLSVFVVNVKRPQRSLGHRASCPRKPSFKKLRTALSFLMQQI